jgi:hypothetical protein
MAQAQPGIAAAAAPQQKPFRVRTVTAFLNLPADSRKWETEVAAAGRFLQYAQQHLESLGEQTGSIVSDRFPCVATPGVHSCQYAKLMLLDSCETYTR